MSDRYNPGLANLGRWQTGPLREPIVAGEWLWNCSASIGALEAEQQFVADFQVRHPELRANGTPAIRPTIRPPVTEWPDNRVMQGCRPKFDPPEFDAANVPDINVEIVGGQLKAHDPSPPEHPHKQKLRAAAKKARRRQKVRQAALAQVRELAG